ncbi:hypothetical protein N7E02_23810 [Aliirhizobium terrae]|uniref:hypothetical protein n=1 Tax=Terrirhizobium terrae TaxID=2926709 RepID=UPI002577A8DA|nr:hypothetical protein [Rhizobium sp. CC-CFT758]WJH39737.1 hypothetical protein N7E02_23810 [Rhizobium sp. CC-CFT758]
MPPYIDERLSGKALPAGLSWGLIFFRHFSNEVVLTEGNEAVIYAAQIEGRQRKTV